MDLASGCPFWPLQNGLLDPYPSLREDVKCDVAVIGAGVTGALLAHAMCEAGVDVVVIDKRDVGVGSTGGCTGLLQYEIDTPLFQLAERIGEGRARRCYQLCLDAIDDLDRLTARLDDRCGFARRPSLYLASRKRDVAELRAEFAARRAMGIELDLLTPGEIARLFPFTAPAALLSRLGGEIDAYRLTHMLLRDAARRGLRAFSRTRVVHVRQSGRAVELRTDRDRRITANKVAFATGYETNHHLKTARVRLKTTYAVASEPLTSLPGWHERCILWESARPYFYARTTPDGRAMVGGADDDFIDPRRRDRALPAKARHLVGRFGKMFPGIEFRPAYRWAGVFGDSDDGLPFIGDCTDFPNAYFAIGYGGNGVVFSVIAARIIRDLFLGKKNPDADLFCFDR